MQDILAQLFSYIWGIWRFRWLALATAWALSVMGWIVVHNLPESYVATSRVYVDSNSVLRPLLKGLAIQPDINQKVAMMSRTLLSRPNLEKLIRMTDLDLKISSDAQKEAMLTSLRQSISLSSRDRAASLYSIKVQHQDRELSKRIVQALITVFIESSRSDARIDNTDAQDFLDDQIADYERRLEEAEARLAAFKQRNVDSFPGQVGEYYARLEASRQDLNAAELALREAQNRRDQLRMELDGEEPMFFVSEATGEIMRTPMDSRIQQQNLLLDQLLSKLTNRHPEVVQARALLTTLEAQKRQWIARAKKDGTAGALTGYTGVSNSPVYQGMRTMLAETDANIAQLLVRVAEFQQRKDALEEKVNNIPVVETELKQLDRDYQVIATQHAALLKRRESAMLSQSAEQQGNDVSFRVIDPPYVPLKPSEPNKLLLNAVVLFLAVGAGIALALLMSLIRPVVIDPRSLVKLTNLPLLGSVSLVASPAERRETLIAYSFFAGICVLLLLAFALVVVLPNVFAG